MQAKDRQRVAGRDEGIDDEQLAEIAAGDAGGVGMAAADDQVVRLVLEHEPRAMRRLADELEGFGREPVEGNVLSGYQFEVVPGPKVTKVIMRDLPRRRGRPERRRGSRLADPRVDRKPCGKLAPVRSHAVAKSVKSNGAQGRSRTTDTAIFRCGAKPSNQ